MKFGLHTAMVERLYPLPKALEKAAEFGAEGYEIDIGIGKPGERWEDRYALWQEAVGDIRSTAKEAGISLPSLCLGVLWQHSLASADDGQRATGVQIVLDCLDLAASLGATAMLLLVGQPEGLEPAEARIKLIASLKRCTPKAEQAGITLALENVCQPLLHTADDLVEVVDAVGSSACGVYYDPGNQSFIGVDPVPEIYRLDKRISRLHLKDTLPIPRPHLPLPPVPISGDFTVWRRRTTVTLGTGELDYAAIRRAVEEIGYSGGFVLEVPQSPETVDEGCRINLAAARGIFA
jgi:L-ribulose-5-phosphate 3-epimerase